MKLIALRDFANNIGLDPESHDLNHDGQVDKGTVFEIGQGVNDLKTLAKRDKASAMLVAQLTAAGCVGDATDAKVVKAVQDEIALDKKREETAKRLNAAADGSALVAQLTALLAKAAGEPAKK